MIEDNFMNKTHLATENKQYICFRCEMFCFSLEYHRCTPNINKSKFKNTAHTACKIVFIEVNYFTLSFKAEFLHYV